MASVACKLVRLEVTSYETGEVTNGREKRKRVEGEGVEHRRGGETRDDARVSQTAALRLQTKYAAYAFVRFVNAT